MDHEREVNGEYLVPQYCSPIISCPRRESYSLFAAACCGCNPAAAAASTVFFSLWIAAAAIQTAATVSACSQPNTPLASVWLQHLISCYCSVACQMPRVMSRVPGIGIPVVPDLPLIKVGRVLSDARQEGPIFSGLCLQLRYIYTEMKSNVSETPRTAVRGSVVLVPYPLHGMDAAMGNAMPEKKTTSLVGVLIKERVGTTVVHLCFCRARRCPLPVCAACLRAVNPRVTASLSLSLLEFKGQTSPGLQLK
jgi:hypothetical protein